MLYCLDSNSLVARDVEGLAYLRVETFRLARVTMVETFRWARVVRYGFV